MIPKRLLLPGLGFGLVLSLVGVGCSKPPELQHLVLQPPATEAPKPSPTPEPPVVPAPTTPPAKVPPVPTPPHSVVVLPVPFTSQAPFGNWSQPYQDACEETSMVMAAEFFKGNKQLQLPAAYADQEILNVVAWEKQHLGFYEDTTAAEVASIVRDYYGFKATVVPYDPAVIRTALTSRHLVLLPLAGRALGNPYFTAPGPLYHMLVVKGYQGNEFITNDPGTRRGENYRYDEAVIAQAVHDWNGGDVAHGEPVMVVVSGK